MSDLKTILSDDHLLKLREVKLFGTYHYVHSQVAELKVSHLASQPAQDVLKIPSASELDKIPKKSDIVKEVNFNFLSMIIMLFLQHSLWKYYDLLKRSFIKSNGIKKPSPRSIREISILKPDISSITFYRHGDEIALVLKGQNLWFCSKINIKSKSGSRFIDTLEADGTSRSIHFNYTPKNENDLLIERHTTTVDIVLYSHFWSSIHKRKVSAECMVRTIFTIIVNLLYSRVSIMFHTDSDNWLCALQVKYLL